MREVFANTKTEVRDTRSRWIQVHEHGAFNGLALSTLAFCVGAAIEVLKWQERNMGLMRIAEISKNDAGP